MTRLEMAQALRAHDNYIILTHRRPDGDTLGSAAGLCLGLRALGKNAWVLKNRQLTPKLAPFTEGLVTDTCPEHATVLSVDIASLGLLSFDAEELSLGDQIALAIDHHGSNDLNAPKLVEADRAACGEIILELLELLGVTLTEKLANALYLAISTDTGCFKYSNTTAHTHEAAARLIHAGADTYPINKAFFDTKSFARLRLEAELTHSIELYAGGLVGLCTMPKSLLQELGISEDDVDSISGFARSIEGVEIGIMIREVEDGGGKISLRTSENYNASELCKALCCGCGSDGSGRHSRRQTRNFVASSPARDHPGALSMANGILIVDKPDGWTSQDVAAKLRGVFHEKRVGHGGTLDPMATGVLPIFIGRATRGVEFFESAEKEYIAGLRLGTVTNTQDTTGEVLEEKPVTVTREGVEAALRRFTGELDQLPPMYSAIKINGQKLYELARKGKEVARTPRRITILELELLGGEDSDYTIRVRCSKGTYVRTLCHDIGQALGCGACMSSLRRTKAGMFTLGQAITIEQLLEFTKENDPQALLMPVDALFAEYPPLIVELGQAEKLRNGAQVKDWHFAPGTYRVYSITGEFLLLGKVENTVLTTIKSFFEVTKA